MRICLSLPASTSNIGAGFDILGLALNIRNKFIINMNNTSINKHYLKYTISDFVKKTSPDYLTYYKDNDFDSLFFQTFFYIFNKASLPIPYISLEVKVNIPPARGLGSSSTIILAGMISANEILRHKYNKAFNLFKIFSFAVSFEKHPDNIAASLWGGFVLSIKDYKNQWQMPVKLRFHAPLQMAGIVPHFSLKTKKARNLILKNISLDILAYQSSRTALLTHLLSLRKWEDEEYSLLRYAVQDKVHQNQRSTLISGMKETFEAWEKLNCKGYFLSGSGTTLLGFWDKKTNLKKLNLTKAMKDLKLDASAIYPKIDTKGLIIEPNFSK
ncbi:MAG: homoserine kinase [Spirochaetia bacterium]|nr:homoserine kinase [Spirochaetia bacterium]